MKEGHQYYYSILIFDSLDFMASLSCIGGALGLVPYLIGSVLIRDGL